jgi:hypothetical protein
VKELFKTAVSRDYVDQYNVGLKFFFNLRNLEHAAGHRFVKDDRSEEYNGIVNEGGFKTVPELNMPDLESLFWSKIKPVLEANNVTFISTCLAFTYSDYKKVNYHLHREALRQINPSPYNYTFFFCDSPESVNFNVVDTPIDFHTILDHRLINYVSTQTLKDYIEDKPKISYELRDGDFMRFDATKVIHGAESNFSCPSTGAYLVLNGCKDNLSPKLHEKFSLADY